MAGNKSISKSLVWVIMGLLVLGLGGYGVRNISGNIHSVGVVGDQEISVDDYSRELQRQIRATEAQTGQSLTMAQARAAGLDRAVLSRLVTLASLDNEVASIGLSIGDTNLQKDIVGNQAFQGPDGAFDRETYRFKLDQAGMSEATFEASLRADSSRTLVQGAVMAGVEMPGVLADTLINYLAARRSFTWAVLDASALPEPLPEPNQAELQAYYDAHPETFTLPETKRLSYVLLTPEMLIDKVELDDAALRNLYDQHADRYQVPERRLVERLVFADAASASAAMAQIEVDGTTFEKLVEDRGLVLSDVDMGDISAADLGDAAGPVFAAGVGDVVGPQPSDLGPALFRVNRVLAAHSTSYEDALSELRAELAVSQARRLVDTQSQNIDDLLAGGATLEDVASETEMQPGQIDWNQNTSDGVAAYDAFRSAAAKVTAEDFPTVIYLKDGGIFALRLDETLPARPEPFDSAGDKAVAGWTRQQTDAALLDLAQAAEAKLASGQDFADAGLSPHEEIGLKRAAHIDGTAPDFMNQVFKMAVGDVRVVPSDAVVNVVQLTATAAPADDSGTQALREAIVSQMNQSLSQALFEAFVNDTRLRARPLIDQRAVNAVQANFR